MVMAMAPNARVAVAPVLCEPPPPHPVNGRPQSAGGRRKFVSMDYLFVHPRFIPESVHGYGYSNHLL